MASIFDRYGIKEVADVVFYHLDGKGDPDYPVLYLDSLKVSTIEQTAENVSARGGKGNPELITWDYNKEITVTLEDALYSMKSMGVMFGDDNVGDNKTGVADLYKTIYVNAASGMTTSAIIDLFDKKPNATYEIAAIYKAGTTEAAIATGSTASISEAGQYFVSAKLTGGAVNGRIEISPNTFPGMYHVQGDTYGRSETTGEDELFIFIIHKAKILSEVTLTMEAEGDPSTFSMNLKVLRPAGNKPMMELIQYGKNA